MESTVCVDWVTFCSCWNIGKIGQKNPFVSVQFRDTLNPMLDSHKLIEKLFALQVHHWEVPRIKLRQSGEEIYQKDLNARSSTQVRKRADRQLLSASSLARPSGTAVHQSRCHCMFAARVVQ